MAGDFLCFLPVTLAQKGSKNMGLSIVFQVVYRICRKDHSTGWSVQSSCDIVPELQQKNFHLSLWALWQPSSYHTSPNFAQRIHHNQRVSWMPFWFNRVDHSYRKLTLIFTNSRDPTFLWQFFSRIWGSFENCMLKVFFPCFILLSMGNFLLPYFHVFFPFMWSVLHDYVVNKS